MKHVVMFRLAGTPEERLATATRFKEALEALPAIIPELESIEVGLNCNPAEEWDIVLTATAADADAIAAYSRHPAHLAATGIIASSKIARACVDY